MALKTFNLDEEIYKEFSKHCKKEGLSMSKKVENFIREEVDRIGKKGIKNSGVGKRLKEEFKTGEHSFSKYC